MFSHRKSEPRRSSSSSSQPSCSSCRRNDRNSSRCSRCRPRSDSTAKPQRMRTPAKLCEGDSDPPHAPLIRGFLRREPRSSTRARAQPRGSRSRRNDRNSSRSTRCRPRSGLYYLSIVRVHCSNPQQGSYYFHPRMHRAGPRAHRHTSALN